MYTEKAGKNTNDASNRKEAANSRGCSKSIYWRQTLKRSKRTRKNAYF
jgi:hypothetical protein